MSVAGLGTQSPTKASPVCGPQQACSPPPPPEIRHKGCFCPRAAEALFWADLGPCAGPFRDRAPEVLPLASSTHSLSLYRLAPSP